ncbi:restin homolog isoform X2 [Halichondria panicea]|uniref:restin homolog isoform X2 n=1 Tax=Halichondria panicea TaxID=6063 RepID=UPI00312B97EB
MVDERADTRLLTLEAHKVPDLESEVEELKKKLEDIEQDTARQYQETQMSQVMEISQKEENLRKLSSEMELLREENASLSSRLQSPTTSDPTLDTDSYQILLQDSGDKDQNVRQLKRLVEEKQMLLEVKAQELQAKSQNMEAENAKQMEEINKLKVLNTKLRDRVVSLATPIDSQAAGASADTTETEVLQQGGAQLEKETDSKKRLKKAGRIKMEQKSEIKKLEQQITDLEPRQKIKATDSDGRLTRAISKIQTLEDTIKELEEQIERGQPMSSGNGGDGNKSAEGRSVIDKQQQQKIRDLEQQIHDLKVGQESMYQAMDDNQAAVDKMSKDQRGLLEHSKSQSKNIVELKDELKFLQESKNEIEASLRRQQDERKTLDFVHKKVISDKAKLEQRVTQLLQRQRDSNSSADRLTKMEADLGRIRAERNELKQVVTELSQKSAHLKEVEVLQCQQKSIAQTAVIENQQKIRRSVIDKQQQQKICDLEQQIHDLKVGQESMYQAMDDNQAAVDKRSKDYQGLLEYSKSQSKKILELKDELKSLQESKNEIEATLSRKQEERKMLSSQYKKVIDDKAKLEQQVTQLLEHHCDSNSSANQITKMEADLARIRTERNELRQIVPELSQKSAHLKEVEVLQCQQKSIAQTAVIENQQKIRRSVIDKQQQQKICDLEQQIHDLKVGQESMYQAMDDNQAAVDKRSKDYQGLLEYSKSQSKKILELKDELKSLQESKNEIEATLSRKQEERKTLSSQYKKVIDDKAKLEQQVTQLLEHHCDSNSSANQITKMEADLARIRTERNELRQIVPELSQKSAHLKEVEVLQCQQKSIAQTAVIENQQKIRRSVIDKQQQQKICDLEQQIHDLKVGQESMYQAMDDNQAAVDKRSKDYQGLLEYSKSQSKKILELKDELKSLQESKNEIEATLSRKQEERKTLSSQYKKVPYSAKFSRHLYFVDWPLKAISLHNVRGMTAYRKPRL